MITRDIQGQRTEELLMIKNVKNQLSLFIPDIPRPVIGLGLNGTDERIDAAVDRLAGA